ncbi:helix-turn-helix domain-containing protein [Gloeobacter morelensis]|uniref:Helix-turn-helix transcriptional regulator n=1 Tax=Gloeobacter morelensis MG652769 TaxID=2781736 RepID=A0ABY3PJW6_9CYAN|nr:AraC family transcriptional regulator [Gloeobacter morelensis]UFP93951.1 helix-turn-helix transcriptional regulator [Gloeobacter morelensis MG652769]
MAKRSLTPLVDPSEFLDERLTLYPAALTSKGSAWDGIIAVEQRRKPACILESPALLTHFVGIRIGPPGGVVQKRDGRIHRGYETVGDIVIMPAGLPGEWCIEDATDGLHLSLAPVLLERVALQNELANPDTLQLVDCFQVRDAVIEHIGLALRAELATSGGADRLLGEALATALALRLIRRYSTARTSVSDYLGGLSKRRLRRVIDYIDAHLEEPLRLSELAGQAGLSPYHFCRLFKQATGITPHQCVIRRRVERAKRLLQQPEATIADVAFRCGFSSQSHLSRHFRQLVGVAPRTFQTH